MPLAAQNTSQSRFAVFTFKARVVYLNKAGHCVHACILFLPDVAISLLHPYRSEAHIERKIHSNYNNSDLEYVPPSTKRRGMIGIDLCRSDEPNFGSQVLQCRRLGRGDYVQFF